MTGDRIRRIDEKMTQLKVQRQKLMGLEKEKERRERTRRLIQNGALAEQYLLGKGIAPEAMEKLLQGLVAIEGVGAFLRQRNP